jgi:hypothetical protein
MRKRLIGTSGMVLWSIAASAYGATLLDSLTRGKSYFANSSSYTWTASLSGAESDSARAIWIEGKAEDESGSELAGCAGDTERRDSWRVYESNGSWRHAAGEADC